MIDPKDKTSHPASDEDAEDIAAFDERADEPDLLFEAVVEDLRQQGQI